MAIIYLEHVGPFTEFETYVRDYWVASRNTIPPSRTRDLLEGIGAKRKIPAETAKQTHGVREFRNGLVHQRNYTSEFLTITQARGCLCTFLSSLPVQW